MSIPSIALAFLFAAAAVAATADAAAFNVSEITFDDGYLPLFGERNLLRSPDGRSVKILLNQRSGSGFISSDLYYHGLFSASIKLPSDYTAGVVVAFYMSNGDIFEKNHDELDFEFLGNLWGREWRIQTNVYGNGSTNRGREERYRLPFDPTAEAHRYSIVWTNATILFYIDEIPIREVTRSEAMRGDYPSKPMLIYATIWDGSNWATSGGKHKVNYKYAPFVSEFSNLILKGCRLDPIQQLPAAVQCREAEMETAAADYSVMLEHKYETMMQFRREYMTYSFCYDEVRYPVSFPDCKIVEGEKEKFGRTGHVVRPTKSAVKMKGVARKRRSKKRGQFNNRNMIHGDAEI
ncbi:probable xyloglucan endotransglucosylase/hydrolase protein 30 [Phalaenopsis equestris]|uniref:probable xyloglucan endotransglucosylase/hydrolase protein 30 n=1 Tax=Phalaenopsis equestris TaxID=78828 RepID=UPI0009E2CD3C|nr:probable xyloglucan endotransglucosylase/hydrolase protein 30 [Phalaenopsis equestris]